VTAAAQVSLACPHAQGVLEVALVTDGTARRSATSAQDVNRLIAEPTVTSVALGLAEVAAWERLLAGLVTVRDLILARCSLLAKQVVKLRFATWTMRDHVWRKRAMRRRFVLRMAHLGTLVMSTVERTLASVAAVEGSLKPLAGLGAKRLVGLFTLKAWYLLLNAAAVALGVNHLRAVATEARVTWLAAFVVTAGHQICTYLLTTPAIFVVCLPAKFSRSVLSAEARLLGAHEIARWARSCVALERARMRASSSWLGARLAARMRWERPACWRRVDVFATPAMIRTRFIGELGVATRASPGKLPGYF
jgi:hypothetical protein